MGGGREGVRGGSLEDEELGAFAERLAAEAERVSLGMTLLKLTCPGVPDVYQGDELPYLALVDPDNRRPVDWEERRRALASTEPPAKLDLIRRTLALRARRPAAFAGSYEPLEAGEDTVAFLRGGEVRSRSPSVASSASRRRRASGGTCTARRRCSWRSVCRPKRPSCAASPAEAPLPCERAAGRARRDRGVYCST